MLDRPVSCEAWFCNMLFTGDPRGFGTAGMAFGDAVSAWLVGTGGWPCAIGACGGGCGAPLVLVARTNPFIGNGGGKAGIAVDLVWSVRTTSIVPSLILTR